MIPLFDDGAVTAFLQAVPLCHQMMSFSSGSTQTSMLTLEDGLSHINLLLKQVLLSYMNVISNLKRLKGAFSLEIKIEYFVIKLLY